MTYWSAPLPCAAAAMTAGVWRRSRARSTEVTTRATAPSLSWQQSSRCSGSTIIREAWWSSRVIGFSKKNAARVGRGVAAVRDGDGPEVLGRGAEVVHVAPRLHRDRGGRRTEPHRVGPGVVEAVGVDLGGGRERELPEPRLRPFVEAAVADHDVGHVARHRHRRLLDRRAGRAAAVVDPAEEPHLLHPQLSGDRDLGGGVHGERREPVHVVDAQPTVGQRGADGFDGELQLGAPGSLGELGGADADDRRPAGETHPSTPGFRDGRRAPSSTTGVAATKTVPVTWSPSDTRPTMSIVAIPSATEVTVPLKVSVS